MMFIIFAIISASVFISHFIGEETEVQRGFTIVPGHIAGEWQSWDLNPTSQEGEMMGGEERGLAGDPSPESKCPLACDVWV